MVGYRENDSLTTTQKLFAGCCSGVLTRFITQPLDIIKLRTQVQKHRHAGKAKVVRTARKIFLEEGISAFWHGHFIGQLHSILAVASQFYTYEMTTQYMSSIEKNWEKKPQVRFICGIFSGTVSATLVTPLEVIRVRQMLVKDQYKSLWQGAHAVYRYGGLLAFYEGLSASILQLGPQVGLSFLIFSYMQTWILKSILAHKHNIKLTQTENTTESLRNQPENEKNNKNGVSDTRDQIKNETENIKDRPDNKTVGQNNAQDVVFASTLAGSVAGLVSKTATYPLDLAKRRLQIGSHKISEKYATPSTSKKLIQCRSLTDCITKTFRREGVRGLFKGWGITIWKSQVTSVVAFTTYELLCFIVRGYNEKANIKDSDQNFTTIRKEE